MRNVVVQTMEDMVGELPDAVRGAIADRWIADPGRHFERYEIGEITFADQRRARLPGDSLVVDVQGALSAGLGAIWLDRAGNGHSGLPPLGVNRVESLTEAAALLA